MNMSCFARETALMAFSAISGVLDLSLIWATIDRALLFLISDFDIILVDSCDFSSFFDAILSSYYFTTESSIG